ncbi:putative magnesium transporter MRS2-D isoform X1 [Sorghum bicolor]|uniref:putative magnesium transporter MRS2-D isoform X1 n=1 Tax=Sorghum bicolor TaxID=4558 RepID=UPI00081AEA14|nr:putative magnesium transporter MRS2-D isoform X1 [Sorghum bicolor]|eukprot:XP_021319924.1 putative magnesium transporter MRS2-D isoform X1 [Sorghum bicolor]
MATATATPPRRRHAATGAAAGEWAALSASGEWRAEAIGKHQLVRRTGLSARDLRALDPALSHPSSVMARDRAVVVNLDRVRAVITATEVLVPGPRDPSVAPLVAELRTRLAAASPAPPRAVSDGEVGKDGGVSPPSGGGGGKALPFEFRALEVCLEYACKSLEHETSMLEKEAYPALDALTSRISTLNLEHVRQIKCRLVAIAGGVHKVRDELEHLLDDDADMAAMHLSEKAAFQAASQSSRFDIGTELVEIDGEGDEDEAGTEQEEQGSMTFMPKIDELESLLEVYFVQIDGTLNKLSTVSAGVRGRHGGLHQHHAGRQAEPAAADGGGAVHGHAAGHQRRCRHRHLRHEHPHRALQDHRPQRLLGGRRRHARRRSHAVPRCHALLLEERDTAVSFFSVSCPACCVLAPGFAACEVLNLCR